MSEVFDLFTESLKSRFQSSDPLVLSGYLSEGLGNGGEWILHLGVRCLHRGQFWQWLCRHLLQLGLDGIEREPGIHERLDPPKNQHVLLSQPPPAPLGRRGVVAEVGLEVQTPAADGWLADIQHLSKLRGFKKAIHGHVEKRRITNDCKRLQALDNSGIWCYNDS